MGDFNIIKLDADGVEELRYTGTLRQRTDDYLCIDATFSLDDRDLGYIALRRGDRFREWFYVGRWYNIFRVADADSGALKGWYCNIARPPCVTSHTISAEDLCLDLFVYPDGRTLLLDAEDFARLRLSEAERGQAWRAVAELREMVAQRRPPFDEIAEITSPAGASRCDAHTPAAATPTPDPGG